jgi:hypothetical protein
LINDGVALALRLKQHAVLRILLSALGEYGWSLVARREESPDFKGGTLGNTQAEQSDTGTTENRPPMAVALALRHRQG